MCRQAARGDGEAEVSLGPEFLHPTPENEGMDEW